MSLMVRRLRQNAVLPTRATESSAGLDLCACLDEKLTIPAGETRTVPTGIAIALPDKTVGLIFGRSGLGVKHGIAPANAVGVIDADYRGELLVGLHNHSAADYTVEPNERIAQLVVVPVFMPRVLEVCELPDTPRGENGFGSSGRI
jgi:dUTP pyrophosphatase